MSVDHVTALLEKGAQTGCVEISELNELVEGERDLFGRQRAGLAPDLE